MKLKHFLISGAGFFAMMGLSHAAVIINEVYPGGGSSAAGTAYTRDYIELYNNGATTVDISGWRVSYASATGSYATNDAARFGTGTTIAPGAYYLIVTGTSGTAGSVITTADYFSVLTTSANTGGSGASLGAAGGSVSIFDGSGAQVDVVGWGTSTLVDANSLTKVEGTAAAPAPTSNAFSLNRTSGIDTNDNSADFTNMSPSPTASIPEPTVALLGALGMLGILRRRR